MLLSIITINYNNAEGLKKTMGTVLGQTYKDYEYIVIDGGSTDESVEVIKHFGNKGYQWVSEPDKGIYNAMNKGIKKSTGEYLLFLNSGDYFYDENVVGKVCPLLHNGDIIYGNVVFKESEEKTWIKKYDTLITFNFFLSDNLPHQGSFIRRSLFESIGLYDETIYVCADWKFILDSIFKADASLKYIDMIISYYDFTGISSIEENRKKVFMEQRRLLERDYARLIKDYDEFNEIKLRHTVMEKQYDSIKLKYKKLVDQKFVKAYLKLKHIFQGT